MNNLEQIKIKELIQKNIKIYTQTIESLQQKTEANLLNALSLLNTSKGKLVLCGIGKAGLIAKKVSATFSSLGAPSHFLHPSEALHGDIGSVTNDDIVICFSNSGETDEIVQLVNILNKERDIKSISITGNKNSSLAKSATINIDIGEQKEICHLGLAPTTSTLSMLVIGDLLATSLASLKNFSKDQYAKNHPLGTLGKKLLKVKDIMRTSFPKLSPETTVREVLFSITKFKTGSACIAENEKLLGIFTDGDLRRHIEEIKDLSTPIKMVMTKNPKKLNENDNVMEASHLFSTYQIDEFPVVDEDLNLKGLIDIQDLIRAGIHIQK